MSIFLLPNNISVCKEVYQLSATSSSQPWKPSSCIRSAYSYPSFTGSDNEQSLPLNFSSQPSILSVIPTIGPLHISWTVENTLLLPSIHFFETLYERIFTRSKLADKPKPWRISLLLEIVYGGWTLIRESVMKEFWRFKDPEYGTLFNLLDNYMPLVLSIYSNSFKLNNFSEYFRAMIRMWIMFTCLKVIPLK